MAALQILVLPVKVRILARQHVGSGENLLRDVTGFFIVKPLNGLKGQKLIAQGNALGIMNRATPWVKKKPKMERPERAKE